MRGGQTNGANDEYTLYTISAASSCCTKYSHASSPHGLLHDGILGDFAKVGRLELDVNTVKSASEGIFRRSEDHLALDAGVIGRPEV